jgi:hypothetical protein
MNRRTLVSVLARYPSLVIVAAIAGVIVVWIVTSSSYALSVKHGQDELRLAPAAAPTNSGVTASASPALAP